MDQRLGCTDVIGKELLELRQSSEKSSTVALDAPT